MSELELPTVSEIHYWTGVLRRGALSEQTEEVIGDFTRFAKRVGPAIRRPELQGDVRKLLAEAQIGWGKK
jgi:hypothetical protein